MTFFSDLFGGFKIIGFILLSGGFPLGLMGQHFLARLAF